MPAAPSPKLPPLPIWVQEQLHKINANAPIFGTQTKPQHEGTRVATWFYVHNFKRPHPVSHRPRYYTHANMWFISDKLHIPLRSLQRKVRALEAYGFLRRLTVASKTGQFEINTWQVAHSPIVRGQFYAKVLRGDVLLPPPENPR